MSLNAKVQVIKKALSVEDAAYHVAHNYQGGIPALATRMGKNPNTLQHKLNPSQDLHKLTLAEAAAITSFTGDSRIVDAMAALIGRVSVPVPQFGDLSDSALLDLAGNLLSKQGYMFQEFTTRYADGEIDKKDLTVITAIADQVVQCVLEWKQRVGHLYSATNKEGLHG